MMTYYFEHDAIFKVSISNSWNLIKIELLTFKPSLWEKKCLVSCAVMVENNNASQAEALRGENHIVKRLK